MTGPWKDFQGAAEWCGYKPDSFRKLLREGGYVLPKGGPQGNKYAVSTLDDFMHNPEKFRPQTNSGNKRRTFTPIAV